MNRLTNAGALDGASGWTRFPAALSLQTDETMRGAPGTTTTLVFHCLPRVVMHHQRSA